MSEVPSHLALDHYGAIDALELGTRWTIASVMAPAMVSLTTLRVTTMASTPPTKQGSGH